MKKILIILTVLSFQFVVSQTSQSVVEINDEDLNSTASNTPKPSQGINKFYEYISNSFRVPEYENFRGGKAIVTFVVETDGSLNEIEFKNDIGFGVNKQLKKILKKCPKWKPAVKDSVTVRSQCTIPITIQGYQG